jgi:hypothetical protein
VKNRIAVIGTGRSGTNFFAAVLNELGRDVQHEKFGKDGIASWCLVADCEDAVYGPGGNQLDSNFIVGHQLRNPLEAIGSLTTFNRASWSFISENSPSIEKMPRGILQRAMLHWLDWNERAGEKSNFTWRLEDLKNGVPEIMEALGWDVSDEDWKDAYDRARDGANTGSARTSSALFNPKVGPITQWRRYKYTKRSAPVSWEELHNIDSALASEIMSYAAIKGYSATTTSNS